MFAAIKKHINIVRLLLKAGAKFTTTDLFSAVKKN